MIIPKCVCSPCFWRFYTVKLFKVLFTPGMKTNTYMCLQGVQQTTCVQIFKGSFLLEGFYVSPFLTFHSFYILINGPVSNFSLHRFLCTNGHDLMMSWCVLMTYFPLHPCHGCIMMQWTLHNRERLRPPQKVVRLTGSQSVLVVEDWVSCSTLVFSDCFIQCKYKFMQCE